MRSSKWKALFRRSSRRAPLVPCLRLARSHARCRGAGHVLPQRVRRLALQASPAASRPCFDALTHLLRSLTLASSLLRPGQFEAGAEKYAHPFDGDGLVLSLALRGGRAFARAAFVATPERAAEAAAGKVTHRNTFGTQRSGGMTANIGDVKQKNVANTAVLFWAGRLWALWEALQPYRLDPATLATRGVDTLGGLLREGLPFASGVPPLDAALRSLDSGLGGDAFSAHPHVCGATGNLVTFSYQIRPLLAAPPEGPLQTVLTILEFAPGSLEPLARRDVPLRGYGFVHDFCFTEKYYVVFQNPVGAQ